MDKTLLHRVAHLHPKEVMQPFDTLLGIAGFDAMLEFAEQFDGDTIYVPSVRTIFSRCLEIEIRKEFTGSNYIQLARKYGYTIRQVRRMVKK